MKKTTTKFVELSDLNNLKSWEVEKIIEGGNSALMRLWVNGSPTDQTAWGWKEKNKFKGKAKSIAKKFIPLQTKNTKVGRITSRI